MNVPSASLIGGIWERLICTVRSVLSALLEDHAQQLDDESLRTPFTKAENIVNSRPLSIDNLSDPETSEPITANHLLTLKAKLVLPTTGYFSRPDLYLRRRWRRIQYLWYQFWRRWQQKYCLLQQKRQKFKKKKISPNSQVGETGFIRHESCPCESNRSLSQWKQTCSEGRSPRHPVWKKGSSFERSIHKLILIYLRVEIKATQTPIK